MTHLTRALAAALVVAACGAVVFVGPSSAGPNREHPEAAKPHVAKGLHHPGIHHVALKVADFDRTVRFYTQGVGMKRVFGWGKGDKRGALLDTGDGSYVEVFAGGKRRSASSIESPIFHFALRTGDPDVAYKRAMAAGATSQMAPKDVTIQGDHPLKIRIAFVVGPDGEAVEFFRNDEF